MFKYLIFILVIFISNSLKSEDNLLTLKQQLDRLQRDVSDLSQSVYSQSVSNGPDSLEKNQELKIPSNLTAFDLRIYDLEKDLKKLNENFENIIFEIDDLKNLFEKLSLGISSNLIATNKDITELNIIKDSSNNPENTLGTIVINSKDLSDKKIEKLEENKILNNNLVKLSPEEEYQKAFDMIRNQEFDNAKKSFQIFINNHGNNKLSGSAHYWLGEIYILKKEYREAALILAEGFQKFPKSIKAPDMLYKLSESLIMIDKKKNACSTLEKLIIEFPSHKIAQKTQKKITSLSCNTLIE